MKKMTGKLFGLYCEYLIVIIMAFVFLNACSNAIEEVSKKDTEAPITTSSPPAGFYRDSMVINLNCSDNVYCESTYYTTADSQTIPLVNSANLYEEPIRLDAIADQTTITYVSVDNSNNIEAQIKQSVYIVDRVNPTVSVQGSGGLYNQAQNVAISCDDQDGSGCSKIYYVLKADKPTIADYQEIAAKTVTVIVDSPNTTTKLWYYVQDKVGNTSDIDAGFIEYQFENINPVIISTIPAKNTILVDTNASINIQFSEIMNNNSLNEEAIQLSGNGSNMVLRYSYDKSTNSLKTMPSDLYALNSSYLLTINNEAITDLADNPLAQTYTINFKTRDGNWGDFTNIGAGLDTNIQGWPNGEAVTILSSNAYGPMSVRKLVKQGISQRFWDNEFSIVSPGGQIRPTIYMNEFKYATGFVLESGEIFVVNHQLTRNGTNEVISRTVESAIIAVDATVKTKTIHTMDQFSTYFGNLEIQADIRGNAIVVWQESSGVMYGFYNSTVPDWSIPKLIMGSQPGQSKDLDLTVSAMGDVYIFFTKNDKGTLGIGTVSRINMLKIPNSNNAIDVGANFNILGSVPLSSLDINSFAPKAVSDISGNIMLLWIQGGAIKSKKLINNGVNGWSAEVIVYQSSLRGVISNVEIAINENGNLFAVWQEKDGTSGLTSIWSNRLESDWTSNIANFDWQSARSEKISGLNPVRNSVYPKIKIDKRSNALVVWRQDGITDSAAIEVKSVVMSNRLTSGWINKPKGDPVWSDYNIKLVGEPAYNQTVPKLVVDSNGRALLLWNKLESNGSISAIVTKFE